MATKKVRVRLAPSPTGEVHIGTIWLAQFNWLFAKQHRGRFVLRIEDTDRKRLVDGSIENIYAALDWYGLVPDEGPKQGGNFGPYVQSQRLDRYREYAERLVANGHAYWCFCTPDRLEKLRHEQQRQKLAPRYDKRCATLDKNEVAARLKAGESAVIRLNLPTTGSVTLNDLIRGPVTFNYNQIDDSVILKSDGFPTYHLAVVVDDHLMEISHVIRGEEWLPSVPKHLFIYQALGWPLPQFAHMPLILGPDKSKLSKRHGAASALSFKRDGFLPEAMGNFLVLMGWHPKGDQEILSRDQVVKEFDLNEVNPSGAVFDRSKLEWLNGYYIRQLTIDELWNRLRDFWHRPLDTPGPDYEKRALRLVQERLKYLTEIDQLINFIFPSIWDANSIDFERSLIVPKKGSREVTVERLKWVRQWLDRPPAWSADKLKTDLIAAITDHGYKNLEVLWPLRAALTLRAASPDVFDILELLGRDESLRRIDKIIAVQ